ncbi:hypothetical protein SAMN02745962_03115 [Pseudomonas sp. LAIL14HWK12:I11]|nr:hypothetical protein SAMN02745962_03115 [Pseudomonas sp. LAIL14HWK12:I11]SMR77981.1 hypothetical protein SAMN05661028_03012 [Pseudomonas sp. LAIL14HWK12:I10]SOD04268.1 hypothetical protein SAMN05660296_02867 [Pseudomonas sp. LAIL14HWK12:I8]
MCRIYSVDGTRFKTVTANQEYDLSQGPAQVQLNTTAPMGDISEWDGGSEALHRIEFQFGNGNTRNYTVKVYKDADVLKTAIIGATDQGAQYLAHRGQVTRLNTLFARELTVKAVSGIDSILNYDTQHMPEPKLGVVVRLTLPVYNASYHGEPCADAGFCHRTFQRLAGIAWRYRRQWYYRYPLCRRGPHPGIRQP